MHAGSLSPPHTVNPSSGNFPSLSHVTPIARRRLILPLFGLCLDGVLVRHELWLRLMLQLPGRMSVVDPRGRQRVDPPPLLRFGVLHGVQVLQDGILGVLFDDVLLGVRA